MLSCEELTKLLTDYFEERLPWATKLKLQMHLAMCKHCRAYVAQMRAVERAAGSLPKVEITESAHAELLEHFREWKK